MIKTKIPYLNKKIIVEEEEPSTLAELVTLIGEEGVVSNAVANLRYRNKYPRVYKRISLEVSKLGFQPKLKKMETAANGSEKPIYQDDLEHIRSFYTAAPDNAGILRALFVRVVEEEPLFIRGDRSGGGKVAQGALDAAHRYFAEGQDKVEEVIGTIENMLPGFHVTREPDVTPEALARGIQTLQRHLISKAKTVTSNL